MVKLAFTMIELIFAIVVIGISIMSLPIMTNIIDKGVENNLNQEAIFAASAKLMDATSGYWDENSMQDANKSYASRVINIDGDCNATTKLRAGHINQAYHRRCLENLTTQPTDISDGNFYDIDDATHLDEKIFVDYTDSSAGYKEDFTSSIKVKRDNDIKTVTITIKDENSKPITMLKTQSANIGETEYFKRTF